jgi:hypothetical protein
VTSHEVVSQPFTLWRAPTGTAFPRIDLAPGSPWSKVGTTGDLNYSDRQGIVIRHSGQHQRIVPIGASGPRDAYREGDEWLIALTLVDLSLEQYALAVGAGDPDITDPSPTAPGWRTLALGRGIGVLPKQALLVRGDGASPYGENWNIQYEVPLAVQVENAADIPFRNGEQAGIPVMWLALEGSDGTVVRVVAQDADIEES